MNDSLIIYETSRHRPTAIANYDAAPENCLSFIEYEIILKEKYKCSYSNTSKGHEYKFDTIDAKVYFLLKWS